MLTSGRRTALRVVTASGLAVLATSFLPWWSFGDGTSRAWSLPAGWSAAVVLAVVAGAAGLVAVRSGRRASLLASCVLAVGAAGVLALTWARVPTLTADDFYGAYAPLQGIPMSSAYESTLSITFDDDPYRSPEVGSAWGLWGTAGVLAVQAAASLTAVRRR